MIKAVSLGNFKSIKAFTFKLRNLNLLVGLNGMGKSTFIQSLLLLRQSKNLQKGELILNGELINIGNSKDAFYQYAKNDIMSFSLEFDNDVKQKFDFVYLKDIDYFEGTTETETDSNFFYQSLFNSYFQYLSTNRLPPVVIHEKSDYEVEKNRNIGINGEYAVHYLERYGNIDIRFDNLIHKRSETFQLTGEDKVNRSLLSQVNHWMGEISPNIKLSTSAIPNSDNVRLDIQYKQPTLGFTEKFRPTNVGFGISYVLPIVIQLLSAENNKLLIIENPESHIHPRGQVEMGKLIALASMNDVQIIVETHSDHILNGIRVATKEFKELSERIKIFYFDKQSNEIEQFSEITDIEVDANGELSQYPKHLLNEWSTQLLKLI